ncbi:hypothetical protein imdm_1013 [gamma proteobacterium IMCC2047]|nr:hypothetical protein imdm_1013 [gamma proteobacterium IMCC2047]
MYAISALLRRTFFQDKTARKRYLQVTGFARTNSALNRLAHAIESGEPDQSMLIALLNSGIAADQVSNALTATDIIKQQEDEACFKPCLKACFNLVPPEERTVNVPAMFIGHMSRIKLPEGLASRLLFEQLEEVENLISAHRQSFYSESLDSARKHYFGDITGYQYSPAPQLVFSLSAVGELLQ